MISALTQTLIHLSPRDTFLTAQITKCFICEQDEFMGKNVLYLRFCWDCKWSHSIIQKWT